MINECKQDGDLLIFHVVGDIWDNVVVYTHPLLANTSERYTLVSARYSEITRKHIIVFRKRHTSVKSGGNHLTRPSLLDTYNAKSIRSLVTSSS